jgi:hypothetical protein
MIKKFRDSHNKKVLELQVGGSGDRQSLHPPLQEIEYSDNLFSSPEKTIDEGVDDKKFGLTSSSKIVESETTNPGHSSSPLKDATPGLTSPGGSGDQQSLHPPSPIPAWFHPAQRKIMKNQLIHDLLTQYKQSFKMDDGTYFTPNAKDIKEYSEILKNSKIERLQQMGVVMKYELKLDVIDRLKSVNKKEHAVVTIFNDNQTTDTGVINCYDRTFSRNGMSYMVMTERGRYDPEFKMMHFYYFANRTCPIEFIKGKLTIDAYDAKLIENTIAMKVIEALAAIDMEKFIKIILILLIIMSLLLVVDTFTIMKIAKTVGAKLTGA